MAGNAGAQAARGGGTTLRDDPLDRTIPGSRGILGERVDPGAARRLGRAARQGLLLLLLVVVAAGLAAVYPDQAHLAFDRSRPVLDLMLGPLGDVR
ncbi:hypothetical protein B4N89_32535 [Embleya scabrispora]|uniref:Uncharacterized protein n=1 Tax=Embleya scabrispora TaxID=159449 RepID=A0A1T3NQH0_9ACTN|nr:hypothetical protein [Embleya scabrispora]OPC78861.1 hypothetical protein B4N89_32535 [Embleya scabrispora]